MSLPTPWTIVFGEPLVLTALLIALLLLPTVRYARQRRVAVTGRLGGAPGLRARTSEQRRTVVAFLVVLAVAAAVIAAARPQWGTGEQPLQQRGIDLVIALDVSRSMLAEDVTPSRAAAAAAGLGEMLTHLTGNRAGLVTFAGSAFERAPLTVDLEVLTTMIARSQGESALVQPGTDLAAAIETALTVLDVTDAARSQAILVVSDGEDLEDGLAEATRRAQDRGVPVYTVFAASTTPTALPEASGGTDVTTGQPGTLAEIAEATGGRARDVRQIAGLAVDFRRLQQTQFASESRPAPVERFTWFAGAALALIALAMLAGEGGRTRMPRLRGGLITAVLGGVILIGCGTATWRHVEDGNAAYLDGRYEDALMAYQAAASALGETSPERGAVAYNLANTLYQLRRYEEGAVSAEQAVGAALEADDALLAGLAHYTRGNTAFQRQQWEAARDAYQALLRIDPDDGDAKANLELVLAILEPPPPEEENPPQEAPDSGGEPGDDGEQQPGDQPGQGQGEGSGADGGGEEPPPGSSQGSAPGDSDAGGGTPGSASLEQVQAELEQLLGELGPEITPDQALRILQLAQRANELAPLPSGSGRDTPPR